MRTTPLRFLAVINDSVLPEDTVPDFAFKYIDISQVDSNGRVAIPADHTRFADAPSRARRLAEPGSTVVSTVRPYLRAIGVVPADLDPLVFSTGFAVLRPLHSDHRFFNYACRSDRFVNEVVARSVGVSYPAISPSDLMDIRLPAPDAEEQRRIADFLDDRVARIDQIIAARETQIARLADAYTAWLDQFLDSLGARFGWAALRRYGVMIEQGWSPEADSVPAEQGEPGVLKLGAVRGGAFNAHENKAFLAGATPREDLRVSDGDLLVTRANTPALVGDAAVVEDIGDNRLYLSDLIYRIKPRGYGTQLASTALRAPRARQLIGVVARGTSGSMPKLRGEDILGLEVPCAPPEIQDALGREDADQRRHRDAIVAALKRSMEFAAEYKQSLITAAVTGEIDVTTAGSGIPG